MHLTLFFSVALSCIQDFQLTVDHQAIDLRDVRLRLKGKDFLPMQFSDLFAEYWNVLEDADVFVLKPGGLGPGEHDIRLFIRVRHPFFMDSSPEGKRPDQASPYFELTDQVSLELTPDQQPKGHQDSQHGK